MGGDDTFEDENTIALGVADSKKQTENNLRLTFVILCVLAFILVWFDGMSLAVKHKIVH